MSRILRIAITGLAVGLLAACEHQPLDDQPPQHGEIAPGPGIFSGSDGAFVILGDSEKKKKRY